jgi:hypothetical protein
MQELPILLIPEKADIERDEVVQIWIKRGGTFRRLGKYWIKDEHLADKPLAIYGNQTFSWCWLKCITCRSCPPTILL